MIAEILSFFDEILRSLLAEHFLLFLLFLFLIVTIETGIIFIPFLPGDSLLFLTGTLISSMGFGSLLFVVVVLCFAAIFGDTINYFIGKFIGMEILKHKLVKKQHIDSTHNFYDKYGNKVIFLARFVPIARSVAPFLAGTGKMNFRTFFAYNIIGGIVWVTLFTSAGYFFGNLSFVQENLTKIILIIVLISALPLLKYLKKSN
jgi:membrane-associated protein